MMMPSYARQQSTARRIEADSAGAWQAGGKWRSEAADSAAAAEDAGSPGLGVSPQSKDTDGHMSPASGAAQANVHILIKNTFIQFEDPGRPLEGEALSLNRPRGESCDAVLYTQNIKDRCACPASQLLCIPEYAAQPTPSLVLEEDDAETTPPSTLESSEQTTAADNDDSESQPSSAEGREHKSTPGAPDHAPSATPRRQNRQRNSNFTPSSRSSQEVSPAELMESLGAFEQSKRMPLEDLPMPSHDRTTIMLRNIPNKYTQAMLLEAVNQDFRGLYDFFYLPIDFKNKCNVGYAFINFIHPYYAELFSTKFAGLKLTAFKSKKICEVSWGRVQGLRANIEHYRNSAIMSIPNSQYKPLIFKDGVPLQFPGPAGPIPSVKPRHGRNSHPTPQQA
eukprot:Gregarina_sp_Pseudo_9__5960@NODE_96_length_4316_cov_27_208090_g88_i0_p2_GENE_NODE_96_length_4316_cov_27_208090_g88_i0NODE_96_length_4316_cov_27_208090_g88_i0_p2_ORF_typecomplete_len394_score71_06RRM_2/PF04059_12/6_3e37RRM_1/PF00076_22/0_075Smg4_UPF3/PF03467_15/6_6e03Smg4_UPF3/PF03467_15/0_032TFIIF_alpha/PF05793_12/0_84FXR_C1/PF16096_5/0_28FXR_C1/PF16096_5/4_8e03CAML/PF14963_6/8_8_NODE_96_length_4316_cov_27_208090_g88_i030224203